MEDILLGGVPVALAVALTVQALTWGGFLKTGDARRVAVVVVALVYSALWGAMTLFPDYIPIMTVIAQALLGAVGAVLAYEGITKMTNRTSGGPY